MSFPRYQEYKDSGVDWLGKIPESWSVCALKRIVSLQSGESITSEQIEGTGVYPVYGGNGLRGYCDKFTHDGYFVLIGRQGALCGNINYANGKFWASEHAVVVTHKQDISTRWVGELLRAMNLNQYSVSAAQPGLSVEIISSLGIPVPDKSEQEAIARFLDHETAKIDALISEQEQLITLLKEKRQAVISHAVTKGLDASVPMKDSGVEWLEKVPAHWWPTTLRRCTRSVETGGTPSITPSNDEVEDGVNWFTPGDFSEGLILEYSARQIPAAVVESGDAKVFSAGAVLIVSIGATLGKVGLITQAASANQQINAVIPAAGINSMFLAFSLSVRVDAMKFLSNASTIGIMNQQKTKDIPVAIPPESEQIDIADHLTRSCVRFDALINEATSTMTLLQERRSALISAAVTGQIDVRNWMPAMEETTP